MDINAKVDPQKKYILSEDVQFVPLKNLSKSVLSSIDSDISSFAVCRVGQRLPALVIDNYAYLFISRFAVPMLVTEAIAIFSEERGEDKRKVLKDSYPLLRKCLNYGVLRYEKSPKIEIAESTLTVGKDHKNYKIIRVVNVMEGTEVYEAENKEGKIVALKLTTSLASETSNEQVKNEALILSKLQGDFHPKLIELGADSFLPWFASEWIWGDPVEKVAEEFRARARLGVSSAIFDLIIGVTEAYKNLHSQNILHRDVHPQNIIISISKQPIIIDFGLSKKMNETTAGNHNRGLVAYFMEPEYADALINYGEVPEYTQLSEQFSLAALLYYLLAGEHYTAFNLERKVMLHQIADPLPRTFAELGISPVPYVEQVINKALSKDPRDRFPTMEFLHKALMNAVLKCKEQLYKIRNNEDTAKSFKLDNYCESMRRQFDSYSGPKSNVAFGAAGVSVGLLYSAYLFDDPKLLSEADFWLLRSTKYRVESDNFSADSLSEELEKQPETSIYYSQAGIYIVDCLVSVAKNKVAHLEEIISKLDRLVNKCEKDALYEYAGGLAGVLIGVGLIYRTSIDNYKFVIDFGDKIERKLTEHIKSSLSSNLPLAGNLAVAHGWAGVIYSVLEWRSALGKESSNTAKNAIDMLIDRAVQQDNGVAWPLYAGDKLVSASGDASWCNGSAGFVQLFCSAAENYCEDVYIDIAERAGEHTYQYSSDIADVCCGLTGRAFALQRLGRVTGNDIWMDRAYELVCRAEISHDSSNKPMHSLIKGKLGTNLLKHAMTNKMDFKMPLFENPT